ncbi:MAG: DUF748 domain-containing protein, partial [Caulobacteraceae bacterium]
RYRFALDGPRLTLAVDVDRLTLAHAGLRAKGASADWIGLPDLAVTGAHIDVPGRTVSIGRVEATDPTVEAWIEPGGTLNLGRFFAASSPTTATPNAGGPSWKVALGEADVRGGRIAFADRSIAKPVKLVLTPLDLRVTGLALPSAHPLKLALSTGLEGGGRLAATGTLAANGPVVDLAIQADRIGLARFQPYLDRTVSLNLVAGRLSGAGHATYSPSGGLAYDGSARVDDLRTTDKVLGQDFVDWRSLQAEGFSLRLSPLSISARQVTADAPYARVVVGPGYVLNVTDVLGGKTSPSATPTPIPAGLSFTEVVAKPKGAPTAPPAAPRQSLPIDIGDLTIHDGRMDFADLTVEPHFAAGVRDLQGTVKGLSGRPDSRASVNLEGDVGPYAPVKIAGQVNFLSARTYTDLKMDFHNMEMTTLSPYSGKFAGYRIEKGKLDVSLHYKIDGDKLDAEHHVVINQLQLGEKVDSASAVKLPVKLIVALLKDRHGVIDLPIVIHGTLGDPTFQYWPVIWKAVDDLLVKVATSPFDFLAKLVGGGPQLHYLTFAPGSAALTDADRQSLAAPSKALIDRPEISLDIPMSVDPALD